MAAQQAAQWRRLSIGGGEKGEVIADYLTQRVWVWDGKSPSAYRWHLLLRREINGTTLKFCLSNIAEADNLVPPMLRRSRQRI